MHPFRCLLHRSFNACYHIVHHTVQIHIGADAVVIDHIHPDLGSREPVYGITLRNITHIFQVLVRNIQRFPRIGSRFPNARVNASQKVFITSRPA